MSVFIILLLPLIATALVCIPFKTALGIGRNVSVVRGCFDIVGANRVAGRGGRFRRSTLKMGMLKWIAVDGLSALILLLIAFVAPPRRFTPWVTWRMKI